jgi:hypothetical protein
MIETLDDLVSYIRGNLPRSIKLEELRADTEMDAVHFRWEKREYIIKKSLAVFEVKYQKIFVTGYSLLLQSALTAEVKNEKVLGAVVETLQQAERLIGDERKGKAGLDLIRVVKRTLIRLCGQRRPKKPKSPEETAAAASSSASPPTAAVPKTA